MPSPLFPAFAFRAFAAAFAWSVLALAATRLPAQEQPASSKEAQALYNDAANFQNNGATELAVEQWQKLIEKHPTDPLSAKGRLYLGVCLMQLERYDAAVTALRDALAKYPNFEFAEETLLNLGLAQYSLAEKGQAELYTSAGASLGDLLRRYPQSRHAPQALYFQGESLYRQGKKEESLRPYEALIASHPKSTYRPEALYAYGFALEELGRYDQASKAYERFLKEHPKHELTATIRLRKAETLMQQGDYAAAGKAFDDLAQEKGFEQADRARYQQAYCAVKLKDYSTAGDLYSRIVEQHPASSFREDSAIAAGRCYYQADRLDDADKALQPLMVAAGKHSAEAAHWLCLTRIKQGRRRDAEQVAEQALAKAAESPFRVDLKMDFAEALAQQPDRKEDAYKRFLDISVGHAEHVLAPKALYNAAFLAWEMKRTDEAMKLAAKFVESYPDDALAADAKFIGADGYYQQKEFARAEELLTELVGSYETHADRPTWLMQLANCLFVQNKFQEALDVALPLAGDAESGQADSALMLAARAQRQLEKLDDARATLIRLVENYPNSRHIDHAQYRLGEYAYAQGEHDRAIEHYNRVLTKHANSFYAPYALHGKGWALLKQEKFDEASGVFTAFLQEHPKHDLAAEAIFARGMCRRQFNEHEKAVEDFAAYLASPDPLKHRIEALYEQGLAYTALKNHAGAAKSFETILTIAPQDPGADKAMYELAWSVKLQGDDDAAATWFAKLADEHPQSAAAAEAHFQVAERLFAKGSFPEAIKRYQQSLEKSSAGAIAEQASYKLGWSNYSLKDYEAALAQFAKQAETFPQGALAGEAHFMQAESLFKTGKHEEAVRAYAAARERGGLSGDNEVVAMLHGAQAAGQLGDWQTSLQWVQPIFEKHAESPYATEALYEQAWARHNLKQYADALKDYEQVTEKTRTSLGARARFMMGEIRFLQKEHEAAIRDFQRVMYGYGGAQAPEDVRPWQAKSGYEAGRCSDVLIQTADAASRPKRLEDAIRFYTYVFEKHPQDQLAPAAKQRVEELQKLANR